jgi:plasmid stabilization system protein ParE
MTVELTRRAAKDLEGLDPAIRRKAVDALRRLATDPEAGHLLHGSLHGVRALGFTGAGGAYRAAYVVYGERCLVFLVGPHEGFYALAVRRYRALTRHRGE